MLLSNHTCYLTAMSVAWLPCLLLGNCVQVDSKRVLIDTEGEKWLRVEDAGYMDEEGRLWLVGRVKWRVKGEEGRVYWSTIVEQKVGGEGAEWRERKRVSVSGRE